MNPLVSIIVPTYNRATLVGETLESIRLQTYREIELIVVDDGSVDGTGEIVNAWCSQHSARFQKVVCREFGVNKGKSEAVNYGFTIVTGEFVMILDSDDLLLPDAIAQEIQFFSNEPSVSALCAGAYLLDRNEKTTTMIHSFQERSQLTDIKEYHGDLLLRGNVVVSSTVLFKRTVAERIGGFNPQLKYIHDWDYWVRISREFKFGFLNVPAVYYRTNLSGSISGNLYGMYKETILLLRQNKGRYLPSEIFKAMRKQTRDYLWMAKKNRAVKYFVQIGLYSVPVLAIHFMKR